jgi:acyl-CoA synthetase (AMP-forming)/AMP-acid ligase II/thioesterase domain-containing protein
MVTSKPSIRDVHRVDASSDLRSSGSIAQLLLRAAARKGQDPDLRYFAGAADSEGTVQSYSSLLDHARRVLAGLRVFGLRPQDKVVLLLERPEDVMPVLWACVLGGYVPCPMAPVRSDTDRWERQLAHVNGLLESPLMVTTKELRREIPQVLGLRVALLEELPGSEPDLTVHEASQDDVALLMLTSGSSGNSKAVMLTHGNLLAAMAAKSEWLNVGADDVMMNWISFDHIAAIEGHLLPMSVGAAQIQVRPQAILSDPMRFLRLLDAHRVTLTFAPNFLFGEINKALASRPADFSPDLSALRHIISGGEAIVCATAQNLLCELTRFGLHRQAIVPAFGMTETCAGSVFSLQFPAADTGQEFASLGRPVRGLEIRIVDDRDAPAPDGHAGELQLRGPMVSSGYLNNQEATREAFTADGWFRTGDRGSITDGRLRLVGRSKDSIIVNGVNYFSHDVETVLERLEEVENSYVAAFPIRPAGSDTEQLVIVFSPGISMDDEAGLYRLLVAIRASVVLHWGFRPALILPLPKSKIPKTSLGKIPRSLLRKKLEAGEFAARERKIAELTQRRLGGFTPPETKTESALADIWADLFGLLPGQVSTTASFFDLGGTSVDILRLKQQIQRVFSIPDLPVVSILRSPTIRGLARLLTTAAHTGADAYDPLVPLQLTGDRTPLFCVHPGVGEVLVFVNLAKYFIGERPFYALRARGFGAGEAHFDSFEEMVACYVQAIRAQRPAGPYAIAGYSYGGAVAFEIAKVLESKGERVDFVGIFNLPPHIKDRMGELDFTEGAVNLAIFLSLITSEQAAGLPQQIRGLPRSGQIAHLMAIASVERFSELGLDADAFGAWVDLAQSLVKVGMTYEPTGSVESVSVFYAIPLRGTKEDWLSTQLKKWDGFTRKDNRYIDVPGEHYTLMSPRHVAAFQAILRAELDRALHGN